MAKEIKYCECGCQGEVRLFHHRFIHGHTGGIAKGFKHSDKTKKRMSKSHIGRVVTKETRDKISKANKGKKRTKEQRRRISKSLKGKKHTEERRLKTIENLTGRKCSKETRKKIGNAHKGKTISQEQIIRWRKSFNKNDLNKIRKKISNTVKSLWSDPVYRSKLSKIHSDRNNNIENRIAHSCAMQGIEREDWTHFISSDPYCQIWTKEYKDFIKERDNYECQNNMDCRKITNVLSAHHIDYNKKNCEPWNIITLCISCNSRANADREYWQEFYKSIMRGKIC